MNQNLIITGQTGSGKTYYTLHEAMRLGTLAYLAPCRQTAYSIIKQIEAKKSKKQTTAD